MFEQDF